MRARLRGDVNQLADAALKKSRTEANGDLSSMPIHMADIGSDNFEQEFTLSLMENEGVGPGKKSSRRWSGSRKAPTALRGVRGEDSQESPQRHPLCHALREVRV